MMHDILVVGGGPAGSIVAGHLARLGHTVLVLEDHHCIGRPMQCGGLISPRIRELVEFPVHVMNSMKGAMVHAPNGGTLILLGGDERAVVIDRTRFDEDAASWAAGQGADIRLASRVTRIVFHHGGATIRTADGSSFRSRLVIGADGPSSVTARAASLPPIREFVSGFEIEAVGEPVDESMVEVYTGRKAGEGFFSWVIPVGDGRLRIGTGMGIRMSPLHPPAEQPAGPGSGGGTGSSSVRRPDRLTAQATLHHLMNRSAHAERFSGVQPLSMHGGTIPMGMRDRMYSDGVMVIGDAAGLAKPVSGGGVITGIISARIAAGVANECLASGQFSRRHTAMYQKRLMGELGRELKRAWALRKAFMNLDDPKIDRLLMRLSRPGVVGLMNARGDIDYPGRMAMELLRVSPGLLWYGLRYLGARLGR